MWISDNIRTSVSYTRIQTLHMIHRVCHYTFVRSYIGNAPHIVDTCVLVMNHTKAGYSECFIQGIASLSALLPNHIYLGYCKQHYCHPKVYTKNIILGMHCFYCTYKSSDESLLFCLLASCWDLCFLPKALRHRHSFYCMPFFAV